jgi:tetratricopeptide (TPR) repeat protein
MTTCEYEILVSGYLDGELSAEERERFVAHLPTCGHCQVLVAHWRAVEGALKRQSAARGEAELTDSVQRELTRSGAFRQARRRAWYHRAQEQLRKDWRRYAAVAAVAVVLVAGMYAVRKWQGSRQAAAVQTAKEERRFVMPQRQDVVAEAGDIVRAIQEAAGHPGDAWIVHARLLGSDVQFWLAEERLASDDEAYRAQVAQTELELELVANLRPERADADADVLMWAMNPKARGLGPAALEAQLAGRFKEALAMYEAGTGLKNRDSKGNDLAPDEVAFLKAACRQSLGDPVRAIAGYDKVAPTVLAGKPSPFAAEALVRAGEVCEMGLDSPARARGYYERAVNEYQRQEPAARAMYAIGRTYEEEGRVEEALRAYAALGEAAWVERRVRDAALAREDFLAAAAADDEVVLKAFLAAERLARQPRNRTQALVELIRLTTLHPEATVAADALAAMVRLHLARGDQAAARQAFDRLAQSRPQRLSARAARSLAPSAAEWLVQDVDRDLASLSAVFPELAGYVAEANVSGPENGAAGDWRIVFKSSAGPRGQGRDLEFTLGVGGASKGRPATYPNMGLTVTLEIKTQNEVLTAELRRVTDAAAQAVGRLDRAAQVRLPDGAVKP